MTYTTDYDGQIAQAKIEYNQRNEIDDPSKKEKISQELAFVIKDIENRKEQERVSNSYIGKTGKVLEPIFKPIGIEWQASIALVTGFVAKEVVVSTMGVLYGVGTEGGKALEQALKKSGMTALSALSMMVFVLLYVPCFATVVTIYRETSFKWAGFNLVYTTMVAWTMSFLVYRLGLLLGFS